MPVPTAGPVATLPTVARWNQVGQPVVGTPGVGLSGIAVAYSSDGMTMAVGTPYAGFDGQTSSGQFYVRAYRWDATNSAWRQLGDDIAAVLDVQDGESPPTNLDLNSDGTVLAVGNTSGSGGPGDIAGRARVYQLEETALTAPAWVQLGTDILDDAPGSRFGHAVSLNGNGTVIAVGSPLFGDTQQGQVRVFQYNTDVGVWLQQGSNLIGTVEGGQLGSSIALSNNGLAVASGAPRSYTGSVQAYSWNRFMSDWVSMGSSLGGSPSGDLFGFSVALSADGSMLAIGDPINTVVKVYLYSVDTNAWMQVGMDIAQFGLESLSGWSVSMSDDGKVVAVGAPRSTGDDFELTEDTGQVKVFRQSRRGDWEEIGNGAITGVTGFGLFGYSVVISGSGLQVAVGAPYGNADNSAGTVRMFNLS